ncbi:Rieske 2Fe-2S domain-containing protein [Streptomyces sp. NPDC053048]|uniref:Rieske 2Fe-2S domain-containing protein n=1 Tax=Streptomyces sp. NPDC053048 TaxID=3365694 RepID=UPI0037D459EF
MPVVTFSVAGPGNCVEVAGTPFVYARTPEGSFVMPATCPHRGGPLHLAGVTPQRNRLVCPWHERKVSLSRLRQEVPAVRSGDRVTAVITGPAEAEITWQHKPLSPDLGGHPVGAAVDDPAS